MLLEMRFDDLFWFAEALDYRNRVECLVSTNKSNVVVCCDPSLVHIMMTLDSRYLHCSIAAVIPSCDIPFALKTFSFSSSPRVQSYEPDSATTHLHGFTLASSSFCNTCLAWRISIIDSSSLHRNHALLFENPFCWRDPMEEGTILKRPNGRRN